MIKDIFPPKGKIPPKTNLKIFKYFQGKEINFKSKERELMKEEMVIYSTLVAIRETVLFKKNTAMPLLYFPLCGLCCCCPFTLTIILK